MLMLLAAALASDLPSIDTPVVTGVNNTTDAAVVVGVGDYLRVEDVPYAEADARAFAAFAATTLGIPGSRIWQPRNKNRENIEKAVTDAGRKVAAGGTVWVYFAGHGAADPANPKERLLLGDDVTADGDFTSRAVRVSTLEALAAAGGGRVIVVTDVCYTGEFRSFVPDQAAPIGGVIEWSAAQQGQVAAPLAGTGHGAFTWTVLGALRGWADGEPTVEGAARNKPDGVVTAREARDYVERQLAAMQVRSQVPVMAAGMSGLDKEPLVRGVREAAPRLSVAKEAVSGAVDGRASTTAAGFEGISLDVSSKLKSQACDDHARTRGEAARAARLAWLVKATQEEATETWAKLRPEAESCLKLTDAADREGCAKTVDAFVARAAKLSVSLHAGTESIQTECGRREAAFSGVEAPVPVAEAAAARALSDRLRGVKAPVAKVKKRRYRAPSIDLRPPDDLLERSHELSLAVRGGYVGMVGRETGALVVAPEVTLPVFRTPVELAGEIQIGLIPEMDRTILGASLGLQYGGFISFVRVYGGLGVTLVALDPSGSMEFGVGGRGRVGATLFLSEHMGINIDVAVAFQPDPILEENDPLVGTMDWLPRGAAGVVLTF